MRSLAPNEAAGPPELLMVERSAQMAFAAGALVFPGGRIDDADRELAGGMAHDDAAKVAAIRETIEETAIPAGLDPLPGEDEARQLQDALAADRPLAGLLREAALSLNLQRLTAFARWVPVPAPLLLVGAGIVLSFLPFLSDLHIEPAIFFALFIPPLLFADGWLMPKRDFMSVLRPVLMLAFGLGMRRFASVRVVAIGGAQYPGEFPWTKNIFFVQHLPPAEHPSFFSSSRLTLNVTRSAMREMGWCPSGRLFEAAACGTPIISDWWEGLDEFFVPESEIFIATSAEDVLAVLQSDDAQLSRIAHAARERVLAEHTGAQRAVQFEEIIARVRVNEMATA